ncbi:GtrA family protein [Hymenobacter caeli]|uniref:Flippase GtrA n=1 Tax=Hymenobacter caeli TaxID=2735894 RepID=A0ABX2FKR1_9BACT|nr:GtrA family protein [Hymenobacter caeli]NRT17723.1 putative flippase GtrA [Hymenobacter caeli]
MRYPRLVKAQAAAAAGTAVDFLVTIAGVEALHVWYLAATAAGNAAGGLTNFYLGKHFVFDAARQSTSTQGLRYFVVWLGSLLLNATGVYLFTQVLHLNYVYSKVVVSLLVGVGFNYFLQLHFVFKKP